MSDITHQNPQLTTSYAAGFRDLDTGMVKYGLFTVALAFSKFREADASVLAGVVIAIYIKAR